MILRPGIHFDVPASVYFADPAPEPSLTQSIAKILLDHSPEHARAEHPRLAPPDTPDDDEKYTKEKAIGNALHLLLIGRGKRLAVAPSEFADWRKKEAQAFKSESIAAQKEPILAAHFEEADRAASIARVRLAACGWSDAFREGQGEVVLVWEEDGIWFRTMIDWLTPDRRTIYDLKSTGGSVAPHVIGQKLVDDGWDIQAAMQERGLARLDPENAGRLRHRFPALENWRPYGLVPVELTEHHLTMGRKKLDVAVDLWRASITSNVWPGYPSKVVRPEYPGWAETKWLEREVDYAESGIGNSDANGGWKPGELIRPAEVE